MNIDKIKSKLKELVDKYKYADDLEENIIEYMNYTSNESGIREFKVQLDQDHDGRKHIIVVWIDSELRLLHLEL